MEKENIIIISVIVLVLLLLWGWQAGLFTQKQITSAPEGIILFYGEGCPHCEIVDDFVAKNKIEDQVKFTRLEVWYDKNNQKILGQIAKKCKVDLNSVGVPFLYDGKEKCYVGDVDVINFFKNEAGIQ